MRLVYGQASSVYSNTNRRSDEFKDDPDITALKQIIKNIDAEIDETIKKGEEDIAAQKAEIESLDIERRKLENSCRNKDIWTGLKYDTGEDSVLFTIALLILAHKIICSEEAAEIARANAVDQVYTL
jgi:hypothetical protein